MFVDSPGEGPFPFGSGAVVKIAPIDTEFKKERTPAEGFGIINYGDRYFIFMKLIFTTEVTARFFVPLYLAWH